MFAEGLTDRGVHRDDALISGEFPRRVEKVTIASGQVLTRGALVGEDGSNDFKLSLSGAEDGSETPVAILAHDVDASDGAAEALVFFTGEFNAAEVTFGTGHSATSVRGALRARSLFLD